MRAILVVWLLAAMTFAGPGGCEPAVKVGCEGGCPPGTICDHDTRQCVETRPPDCPQDLGRYLSLAVDSNGRLHFSCYTKDYGDLVVGHVKDDGSFECAYVDGKPEVNPVDIRTDPLPFLLGDDVGLYSSLALDPLDRPHVAYFDRTNGRLKYAFLGGKGWEIVTVPRTGEGDHEVGRACSLALDSDGLPHIAYLDETEGSLKIARKSAEGRWAAERVVAANPPDDWPGSLGGEVGRMVSLVLDALDREWIAFRDLHQGSLNVAGRQPDGWSVLKLDAGPDAGSWIDAALDREGNMALVYHDRSLGGLKYAWNQAGSLKVTVIDDGVFEDTRGAQRRHLVGQHCALAFGYDGLPRVTYLDASLLDARLVEGLPGGGFGPPQVLQGDGPAGFFNDLALGPDGLHAAVGRFGRDAEGELKVGLDLHVLDAGHIRSGGGR